MQNTCLFQFAQSINNPCLPSFASPFKYCSCRKQNRASFYLFSGWISCTVYKLRCSSSVSFPLDKKHYAYVCNCTFMSVSFLINGSLPLGQSQFLKECYLFTILLPGNRSDRTVVAWILWPNNLSKSLVIPTKKKSQIDSCRFFLDI